MNNIEWKELCYKLHDVDFNNKYGWEKKLPYSFHLAMVEKQHYKFKHLLETGTNIGFSELAIPAHDLQEHGIMTYNDIAKFVGKEIAEIIYLCTDFKGRNRAERKPLQLYTELNENKLAVFVKLCDIIANTKYSLLENSTMYAKYKNEYYEKVRPNLLPSHGDLKPMFDYLETLYQIN